MNVSNPEKDFGFAGHCVEFSRCYGSNRVSFSRAAHPISKAYNAIDRFSENVDLFLSHADLGDSNYE